MTSTPHKAPWLLARSAQVAIAAAAVADLFRATALRESYLDPTPANDLAAAQASMVMGSLMLLATVLFLTWLVRSRRIAEQVSPDAPLPGAGWTVGAWFVPVANLFVPRRFLLDIGRATSATWTNKRDSALVNNWWAAWIGHALFLAVFGQMAPGSLAVLVVAQVLMFAAAVLAGLMIQRLTTLQSSAATHTTAAPGTPVAQA
ncbi:DUF4328 domain-containing protein [Streptomyces sp. NPDC056600]|uniref:DUF4328 domain-containing protein n=1 Tax=Streptomyces sp. NPDC056600 TaxID=3345874 RepID=UPI003697821D